MGLVIKNLIAEKHKQNYQISSSSIHKKENREEYIKRTTPIYNELDKLIIKVNNAKESGDIDTLLNTVDKGIELIKQL